MKMNVKIAAFAVAMMGLTVACNQKPAEVEDTLVADTTEIEAVVDTIDTVEQVAEEPVAEEPVKTCVKKQEKKAENAPQLKVANNNESKQVATEQQAIGKMSKMAAKKAGISEQKENSNVATEQNTQGKMQKVANR